MLFKVQVFKRLFSQEHEWSNVYHVESADMGGAAVMADVIAAAEESFHYNNVFFTKARVSNPGFANDFTIVTLNVAGFGGDALDQLPLWNVVRASLNVQFGRPSFKFYRLPLREQDQTNGVINNGLATTITTALTPLLATPTSDGIVDESDHFFTGVTVDTLVHERQVHRRRRRRSGTGGL